MAMRVFFGFVMFCVLLSCEKEEPFYSPAKKGQVVAGMGKDYRSSLYYKIENGIFVRTHDYDIYSLSFSSESNDSAIYLNGANFMFVKSTLDTNFAEVKDTVYPGKWLYDYPSGVSHRTALKDCLTKEGVPSRLVYVVDLGFDVQKQKLPFVKFQLIDITENSYLIKYAELPNGPVHVAVINRTPSYRRVMYDMRTHQQHLVEPPSSEWDFHFTQYTDYDIMDNGDTLAYLVRGVLMDGNKWSVARSNELDWNRLESDDLVNLHYSSNQNAIGYDWKYYSFETATYQITAGRIYSLYSPQFGYYAIRFVDYYNSLGERGYAAFEVKGF